MTLVKWTPRPTSILNDMDKMISNVFENDWNFPVRSKTNWSPPVDVKETDESFHRLLKLVIIYTEDLLRNLFKYA